MKAKTLLLVMIILAVMPFVYAEDCGKKVVDLKAGQHTDAGNITVWNDESYIYVRYTTEDGWKLTETHLQVGCSVDDLRTKTNGGGSVSPGQFTYKNTHDKITSYTYQVPLSAIEGCNEPGEGTIYIAAHAYVVKKIYLGLSEEGETAWGEGPRFTDNTWEMYFKYSPNSLEEICDGKDNDCDGDVDEGFHIGEKCPIIKPYCKGEGELVCENIHETKCFGEILIIKDDNCNKLDEDCDGTTDEHYVPIDTVCNKGSCPGTGKLICEAGGNLVNTCKPRLPLPGENENCEKYCKDFVPKTTSCGEGVCKNTVISSCDSNTGIITDPTCTPLSPPYGYDQNCRPFCETFQPKTTTCGEGVCQNTVTSTCDPNTGKITDPTCTPLSPPNGYDESCRPFCENFKPSTTTCGEGVCKNTVTSTCDTSTGKITNPTCSPLPPPFGYDGNCRKYCENFQSNKTTC
jgi:hypothetical protein